MLDNIKLLRWSRRISGLLPRGLPLLSSGLLPRFISAVAYLIC